MIRLPTSGRAFRRTSFWRGGTSLRLAAGLLFLSILLPCPAAARVQSPGLNPDPNQALSAARTALRTGRYDEALQQFEGLTTRLAEMPSGGAGAGATLNTLRFGGWEGQILAHLAVGRLNEAEAVARAAEEALGPIMAVRRGEVLLEMGRLDEAEAALRRGTETPGPDRLMGLYHLAALEAARGQRDDALAAFDRFIDLYNAGAAQRARDLTAVALAVQALGVRDPDLFRDALRALDEASAADPDDPEPTLRVGELFLAKYNGGDARASFEAVLRRNPRDARALLGRAQSMEFAREGGALETVRQALEINPTLVPALLFLGKLQLGVEAFDEASAQAEQALQINPTSLDALALLAAARDMAGDAAGAARAQAQGRALNPRDPRLPLALADAAQNRRRYTDAVSLAREAVALDPEAWEARGLLGINLLRLGRMEEGRDELERAFAGDPFNVWFKNTLDLLDTLDRYEEVEVGPFVLVIRGDESELMAPLVGAVAEAAWTHLLAHYPTEPETPVRIELYPNSTDFSVRTVGVTGVGALGVAFGQVLAMDSPSARRPGELNWASVLWHEMAHIVHLARSNQAMPRWFGEGLAVYEQNLGKLGWGFSPSPALLRAWADGRLPPVSQLNRSFVRPTYPEEVGHAYALAAMVCRFIAETRGVAALDAMLVAYGRGQSNEAVLREVLRMEPEAVDAAFADWVRMNYGHVIDATDPAGFVGQMREGTGRLAAGDAEGAIPYLERAWQIFPEYAGPDAPAALLARIHQEAGRPEAALRFLEDRMTRTETDLDGARTLAAAYQARGAFSEAERALERGIEIYPFDPALHRSLAEVRASMGAWNGVVAARRSVLALRPVDRAGAHYELARALYEAGALDEARREVLRSLEIAPSFDAALELLLRIRGGTP